MLTTLLLTAVFAAAPAKTVTGDGTALTVQVTAQPLYDAAMGTTHLRMTRGDDVAMETDWPGVWRVLACDKQEHRYVLTGDFQQGAWLPIRKIRYLSEQSTLYTESRYNGQDFIAFAAVPSADGRWVAFIGALGAGSDFRLLLLDTRGDAMVDLAAPPAPPPSTNVAPKNLGVDCPWTSWPCFHDGWVELEPGIVTFERATMKVSYGAKDSPKARDKERKIRTWDLEKVMKDAGVGGK